MKEYMPYGQEQPYIKAGPFKIRFPFIHYRFEIADYIQGLLMCAVCLGAIPLLQENLGMPFSVALGNRHLERFPVYVAHFPGRPGSARLDNSGDTSSGCILSHFP